MPQKITTQGLEVLPMIGTADIISLPADRTTYNPVDVFLGK
jgi:hypothetical protein